jgi:hypothetical protein
MVATTSSFGELSCVLMTRSAQLSDGWSDPRGVPLEPDIFLLSPTIDDRTNLIAVE